MPSGSDGTDGQWACGTPKPEKHSLPFAQTCAADRGVLYTVVEGHMLYSDFDSPDTGDITCTIKIAGQVVSAMTTHVSNTVADNTFRCNYDVPHRFFSTK